ncbi:MAG: AAA family ATPase [bacterium]
MQKRHIITICGVLGSGKSTAAKRVSAALGYPHFSAGDFMREMAKERGISLAELGPLAESDPEIDKEIDRRQKNYMDTHDNFVIDSRLGWYFAPDSFKVFLSLDNQTSAERVFADLNSKNSARFGETVTQVQSIEDLKKKQADRLRSENARYKEYYDIDDMFDLDHFDLIIDTKINNPDAVEKLILEGYKKWQETN